MYASSGTVVAIIIDMLLFPQSQTLILQTHTRKVSHWLDWTTAQSLFSSLLSLCIHQL